MMNRFGKEQNITPFIELKHFSGSIKSIKESLHVLIISGKKKRIIKIVYYLGSIINN